MQLTKAIAWAASQGAADHQMRAAGRTAWNRADYNLAMRTFNRLWPHDRP